MDLEKAYNKIDNFCCSNHNALQGNKVKYPNGEEETIDMFGDYKEYKDDDFCKDVYEMTDALETIKEIVDFQKEIGYPLRIALKMMIEDIHFVYDENGDKFFINESEVFKNQFAAYRRSDSDFINKRFKWRDYGIIWWLKEDRSE